jgi:hypothetical protein
VEVVPLGVLDAAEPELMSVEEPVVPVEPVVPEAPMEVPLPVVAPGVLPLLMALASVPVPVVPAVPVVPVVPVVPDVLAEVSVDGVVGSVLGVVVVVDEEVDVSVLDFSPQAVRAKAATRARAIEVFFIRELLAGFV